jgi:hypothetical protein
MHIRQKVQAYLIWIATRIGVFLVIMYFGGVDYLIAGFSKREDFGLLYRWPVWKKLAAGPLPYACQLLLVLVK